MAGSFQEDLARLNAEAAQIKERAERRAARQRFEDYQAGQAKADQLVSRATIGCRSYNEKAATLAKGAAAQPNSLEGRVAAGLLSEAASDARRQAERIAIILADRRERSRDIERER